MSTLKRRAIKFIYHSVLHADDSPHQIAMGIAVATFVAFTPTIGFQTFIAVALAAMLRANKAVCIPVVWISNPLTIAPIYLFCCTLGAQILPGGNPGDAGQIVHRMTAAANAFAFSDLFELSFWSHAVHFAAEIGAELWVGGILVGLACALPAYGVVRWLVSVYRARRAARRRERRAASGFLRNRPRRSSVRVRTSG